MDVGNIQQLDAWEIAVPVLKMIVGVNRHVVALVAAIDSAKSKLLTFDQSGGTDQCTRTETFLQSINIVIYTTNQFSK